MKKTWTTRILIALMTLALAAGAFGIAPREALAAGHTITTTSIPDGTVDTIYAGTVLQVTGNTGAITWAIQQGTLPAGLSLDTASGAITGTPTAAGAFQVQFKATDDADQSEAYSNVINFKVVGGPTTLTAGTVPTGKKVGESFSLGFTVGVAGKVYPTNCTYSYSGMLPPGTTLNTGTGEVSGTRLTTAGTFKFTVSATNGVGSGATSSEVSVTVGKNTTTISVSPANPSTPKGTPITLTASSDSTGAYEWKDATGAVVSKNASYTFTPTATTTLSVAQEGDSNYEKPTDKTGISVTVTAAKPNLSISPSSKTVSYGSSAFALSPQTLNQATTPTWSLTGPGTLSATSGWSVTYTPPTTGTAAGTATITVNQAASADYEAATATATISVNPQFDVPTTSITTKVGATPQSFGVTTGPNTTVTAVSNNTKVATVSPPSSTGAGHTFTVTPVAAGDATITVTDGATSKTIAVHVQSQYPVIDVQFWAGDNAYPTNTLAKGRIGWGTLKVTVKDYNPANPYVTVTRSNIRTYIGTGYNSYYSHPSTYAYTAYLTPVGNDGQATLAVYAQYNGSTHYTASYSGAVSVNSPTIYVTGYTTLPQTGPDYTWAYVLGGLCLVTVATAVTLNVRKKKRESV